MIKTPICDFVQKYADSQKLRLHMPGHKGIGQSGCEKFDITEIDGADVLYSSAGIIRESEDVASGIFATARTVYSAEGSSLAIRAMMYLVRMYASSRGIRPVIAAGRNAHKTFITAAAMCDIETEWLYGENSDSIISCNISASYLNSCLDKLSEKPVAVYITSPDYTGNIADIKEISEVCRKHSVLLLVDNAHGAYLRFLPEDMHPISLGADMCCDSAHKTLPVLTGGAYLHISGSAPAEFAVQAENAMSIFASTSPSYMILRSLDAANAYIADGYAEKLAGVCAKIRNLKSALSSAGFQIAGNEPTKLTIAPKSYGYSGVDLAQILDKHGIVCEFADPDYTVMMLNERIADHEILRLENILTKTPRKLPIKTLPPRPMPNPIRMSAREAVFSPHEQLDIQKCRGRILASPTVSCPPAIPIAVCGEEITENAIRCFEYYGISTCSVVQI